jgi:general L-amino acid transport system substrate-binding protein
MRSFRGWGKGFAGVLLACLCVTAQAGAVLDAVKRKGHIDCGVSDGLPGFAEADAEGRYRGLDVDFCRAVAAAVFGDAEKVRFHPLAAKDRFTEVQSAEIDLLSRHTTWSSSRDSALGLNFVGVILYDGQGFLLDRKLGAATLEQLGGTRICVQAGTTSELNLAEQFRARGLKYTPITYDNSEESAEALESGRCDLLTSDRSQLHAQRSRLKNPQNYLVLSEVISKEPLGPAVRQGDEEWFDIVRWTLFALINAEELEIDSANVEAKARETNDPDVARLLGKSGEYGADLKLKRDWVVKIISQVGNYGEIFERNLGKDSPLGLERGLNQLWTRGGLHFAPPVR